MRSFSLKFEEAWKNLVTHICARHRLDGVVVNVQIGGPARSKIPGNGLQAFQYTNIPPECSAPYLPQLHILDDTARNLAERDTMWPVNLLKSVPPLCTSLSAKLSTTSYESTRTP